MGHFTREDVEKLLEGKEVVSRLTELMATGGAAYFEEARSHLFPRELREYLDGNLDERIYLKK